MREDRTWRCMRRAARLAAALALAMPALAAAGDPPRLHVPSPDWRDQVIYFVMVDRFDDGDPRNNDQGAGEYDPADSARFSGGDLAGLRRRLDYVQGLGATAVWITPPVANQWWNTRTNYGGYHGYWAEDFKRVDAHFGTLDDYRALSDALHRRGMYLVQDVVVNHVGNYFHYEGAWSATDPVRHFAIGGDGRARSAPTQAPFDRNDVRQPRDRAAAIYHWTPDIVDYGDIVQERTWQLAGLDDLNTDNPVVRRALRDSYGFWIREVGVDAFRIDTAFYVDPAYFRDFMQAEDRRAPGMARVAAATGRRDFLAFGEGFAMDRAYEDAGMRKIDGYLRDAQGPLLPSMIQFPLYGTLGDVFARGRPPSELADRIERTLRLHADPHRMPTFVDNHDVDRFLAGGSEAGLRQALLAMLTLPGIPVVYYGTEQGFTKQRAAMFAGGWGSGGRDHFDTASDGYRWLQSAIALRRGHRVFSRGTPRILQANGATPGVLAYTMAHEGETALVVFNTADRRVLLDNLTPGAAAGTELEPLFALGAATDAAALDDRGTLTLALPARSARVWRLGAAPRASLPAPQAAIALDAGLPARVREDFAVSGTARGVREVRLVVDGDLDGAIVVPVGADGRWRATVDTASMADARVAHTLVAWSEAAGTASARHAFTVDRAWTVAAEAADPADDDHGPEGRYRYPTDPSWGGNASLDIRRVRASTAGGALRLELEMGELLRAWNPANGFDHAAFFVHIDLPGRDGTAVMPLQDATLPDGLRWDVRLRAHGWSNALFTAEGADATNEGGAASPGASLEVDAAARIVRITIPAAALGNPRSLSGARVHVSTWDWDGGPRRITPEGGSARFGGAPADAAKVMDAAVVAIP